jgi:hypothetical protein
VPKAYDLDYLVFQLAEGDITKSHRIWNEATFEECIHYVCFKQYEAYVQERMMKANG